MEINKKVEWIARTLQELYPSTKTFLNYTKDYELLFATILSAQATDKSVNLATSKLFALCPTLTHYHPGNRDLIFSCIKPVGLSERKTDYLIQTARILLEQYDGKVPLDRKELMNLPGVGYKTSGVVLAELYDYPYIPVDTHVFRVTHRLGIVKNNINPEKTEVVLEKEFKNYHSIHLHRQFILLGRNICKAKNELCESCPLSCVCNYYLKKQKKEEKVST